MESNAVGAGAPGRGSRLMLEGVGVRVVRGPDWKWGKQVAAELDTRGTFLITLIEDTKGGVKKGKLSTFCG